VSFWDTGTSNGWAVAINQSFTNILAATQIITSISIQNLTSVALSGTLTVVYETVGSYGYGSGVYEQTDILTKVTCTQGGVVTTAGSPFARYLGLFSKAFAYNGTNYVLCSNNSQYQPTYFLIDFSGNVVMKLAYSNGSGYSISQVLSSPTILNGTIYLAYLYKAQIVALNKNTTGSVGGVYSNLGVNLAAFSINQSGQYSSEIANALHLTGGFLWEYDGTKPVEHGFHVYPEFISAAWSASGGSMVAQPDSATNTNAYAYQITYEWTDAQGNIHRSAPSLPVFVTTTGSGSSGSVALNIPYLRLTYKSSVRIIISRWSIGQQVFYQVNSVTTPTLNVTTSDSFTYTDTLPDSSIIGNTILYTTGGVVEDIAAPACVHSALYKSRLFLIDAEDRNVIWYSKQVIEATPVEMSDLFTIYVAPTSGAQGSTGPMTALSAMDDKLIVFKANAIYYITGNGPDNTGANNDFSEPVFITAAVGCVNPASIVLMPQGLMFQSNKGIWLLSRDLTTSYIGAAVQGYNSSTIYSAVNVPNFNQVRFTLSGSVVLTYDYFVGQWSTYSLNAISSTIYGGYHTILNSNGQALQETPQTYLDGSNPVLMGMTTGWLNLANLQGFERVYYIYLLANYLSPHTITIQLAYDYNPSPVQTITITPDNVNSFFGSDPLYGDSTVFGGSYSLEQWRINPQIQKCQSIQITIQENYDATKGLPAGAGFTISGLNIVYGTKKSYPVINTSRYAG
jgi:hypothetical protein